MFHLEICSYAIFFSSFVLSGSICAHIFCYLLVLHLASFRQVFFVFSNRFLVFWRILSFGFCLSNSECNAYLPVDHSLVYSHPKIFLLFFSLILRLVENQVSQFITSQFITSFCPLLMDLSICRIGILSSTFPCL